MGLWDAMDQAADDVAQVFVANGSPTRFSVFTAGAGDAVAKSAN